MSVERLTRIEDKLDKVVEKISSVDATLSAQHVSLKEHMRRTELLEESIKPIQKHVTMIHGGFKLVGMIAVLTGMMEGIIALLDYLRH